MPITTLNLRLLEQILARHRFFGKDTERRKWQNPEALLADIGVTLGSTLIDLGCGEGFFAIPASRIVGKEGKVYCLDRDATAISILQYRLVKEGLLNVEAQVGRAEDTVLCTACADIIFFGIVLHDFDDPGKVLMNARKMLKPSGRVVDLDWEKKPMVLGPPLHKRFSRETAISLMEEVGFEMEIVQESGLYHYLLIAKLIR
ncbi:class I SAM-dependent methyltransferase [Candidatus Bathyarchaeota archaeon]|nr:class I SAM-dependent methyltransferase [Candidatus Bathyarchaeota archaeon]